MRAVLDRLIWIGAVVVVGAAVLPRAAPALTSLAVVVTVCAVVLRVVWFWTGQRW